MIVLISKSYSDTWFRQIYIL